MNSLATASGRRDEREGAYRMRQQYFGERY